MMLRSKCLACALVLAAAAVGQGRVWIVDASGGPMAQFTDMPPAVAAAADGDTLIVRSTGTYSGFSRASDELLALPAFRVRFIGAVLLGSPYSNAYA